MAMWICLAHMKKSQGKTLFGVQFHVCGKCSRSLIQTCLYNGTLHQSQGGAVLDSASVGGSGLFSLYKLQFLKGEKLNTTWDSYSAWSVCMMVLISRTVSKTGGKECRLLLKLSASVYMQGKGTSERLMQLNDRRFSSC